MTVSPGITTLTIDIDESELITVCPNCWAPATGYSRNCFGRPSDLICDDCHVAYGQALVVHESDHAQLATEANELGKEDIAQYYRPDKSQPYYRMRILNMSRVVAIRLPRNTSDEIPSTTEGHWR